MTELMEASSGAITSRREECQDLEERGLAS